MPESGGSLLARRNARGENPYWEANFARIFGHCDTIHHRASHQSRPSLWEVDGERATATHAFASKAHERERTAVGGRRTTLTATQKGRPVASAVTGADGSYRFRLAPGSYVVTGCADATVVVIADQVADQDISCPIP